MTISLATYQTAFHTPGGGESQFANTFRHLRKLSSDVHRYDMYNQEQWENTKILHLFSVCSSIEHLLNSALMFNIKTVVSPIHWPTIDEINTESERNRIRHILLNSDAILCNSQTEISQLRTFYSISDKAVFHTIVNGVSDAISAKVASYSARQNRKFQRIEVLFCGNIEPRKNLIALCMACKKLDAKLTIAGRIRDNYVLSQIRRMYPDVTVAGAYIPYSQRHYELLSSADVFCLPSKYETPGLAALEAAIFGIPVCITKDGCTIEYFGECVEYCDPKSPDSIASSIITAFNKRRIQKEDCIRLNSLYNWKAAARQTFSIYQLLLNN